MTRRFVSYLRVSTTGQGQSGLGLEAQREAVNGYLASVSGQRIAEHVEVESGKVADRPGLKAAIGLRRREKATLLIARLDRLSRNVSFISSLMDGRVDFVACDAPYANRLMLHILAAFAEHEREQIAARTRAALTAAKARGVRLGANGCVLAARHRAEAADFAETLRGALEEAGADRRATLAQLAAALDTQGLTTREGARWSPGTVARVVDRLGLRGACATATHTAEAA